MRRAEKRKKIGGKLQRDFQLNRSISTYGKVGTRLVTDLPNSNWLPSDDSLPITNKPNVLTNVTNQQSQAKKNHQLKLRKASVQNSTLDSDDDFRLCKKVGQGPKRTRQEKEPLEKGKVFPPRKKCKPYLRKAIKVSSADKENHHFQDHKKCLRKRNTQNHNSVRTSQKKRNSRKSKPIVPLGASSSKNKKVDFNGHDVNHEILEVPNLAVTGTSIVLGLRQTDNDPSHQIPVPTTPIIAVSNESIVNKFSDSDGMLSPTQSTGLPRANTSVGIELSAPSLTDVLTPAEVDNLSIKNDDISGIHASVDMRMNNEQSTDLFSSRSFKAPELVRNPSHTVSGMLQPPDGPKSPVCTHSFNSTVIGHAADFEITDASSHRLPDCHPKAPKLGLIQSTPVANPRKLKKNLITASDPKMSLKISISAPVASKQNMVIDKETQTNKKKVAERNRNVYKSKVARKNRPKKLQKPKHFSKRIANKCNRSMKSSKDSSILQHIMVGNTIKQYQYDFLENSQDAYFVDTFSKSVEGVQLGKNEKKPTLQIQDDPVNAVEATVATSHSTNCSVTDYVKSSDDEVLNAHSYSSKKKCLRKRARVDYKLMISGSWYAGDFRNPPNADEVRPTDVDSIDKILPVPVCKNKTHVDGDRNSHDQGFELSYHHLENGNINQRRKYKPTKPTTDSSLFSPLILRSYTHFHSNHLESPKLDGRSHGGVTPKRSHCAIRSRSPGSHLKTPVRVFSRRHDNKSNINTLSESLDKASPTVTEQSISNSIFQSTSVTSQSSKVVTQSLGFAKALSPVGHRAAPLVNESLTEKQKVLIECNQVEPIVFENVLSGMDINSCRKLGEGVYGEVFGIRWKDATERIAMKVIPIEGDLIINDERQKTCGEILPEILSSKELTKLSSGFEYATDGFVKLHAVHCVKGKYPESLLNAWDIYDTDEGSQNDRPDSFEHDQLYILLLYSDGGTDVEHYKFRSATQAYSVIQQVCAALAVAEKTFEFEHRDLHWGNVLVTPTKSKEVTVTFASECFKIQTNGVKVTIIDFTLSRLSKGGVTVFQDMSSDPEIFNGDVDADYQYEIYRMMKDENQNDWSRFCPKTNIFWLHYLVMKFLKEVKYSYTKTSRHNSFLSKCRFLSKTLFDYNSCSHALFSCPKLSV